MSTATSRATSASGSSSSPTRSRRTSATRTSSRRRSRRRSRSACWPSSPHVGRDPLRLRHAVRLPLVGDVRVRDALALEEARRDGDGAVGCGSACLNTVEHPTEAPRRRPGRPASDAPRADPRRRLRVLKRRRLRGPDHGQGRRRLGSEQGADLLLLRLQAGPGRGGRAPRLRDAHRRDPRPGSAIAEHGRASSSTGSSTACGGAMDRDDGLSASTSTSPRKRSSSRRSAGS